MLEYPHLVQSIALMRMCPGNPFYDELGLAYEAFTMNERTSPLAILYYSLPCGVKAVPVFTTDIFCE